MPSDWFIAVNKVRRIFETGDTSTVLGQPGHAVAELPYAFGGDPRTRSLLRASIAASKAAFFQLLQEKAHFLLLPEPIVIDVKEASIVDISEEFPSSGAIAETTIEEGRVQMRIPGSSAGLAELGIGLGKSTSSSLGGAYRSIGVLYHEMTHAWLDLQELGERPQDADLQKLLLAYQSALQGTAVDPRHAFSEAAAYYVQDRINRWCKALEALDVLIRNKPQDPEELRTEVQGVVDAYDSTFQSGPGPAIGSPQVWAALRDAVNTKVLDGRPLTKNFADTPLVGLRAWAHP